MCVLKKFNFSYKGAPGGVLSKKEQSYYSFLDIVRENSNQKVMVAILKESYVLCMYTQTLAAFEIETEFTPGPNKEMGYFETKKT